MSHETELWVLKAMASEPWARAQGLRALGPEVFSETHAAIFAALAEMEQPTPQQLFDRGFALERMERVDRDLWRANLGELARRRAAFLAQVQLEEALEAVKSGESPVRVIPALKARGWSKGEEQAVPDLLLGLLNPAEAKAVHAPLPLSMPTLNRFLHGGLDVGRMLLVGGRPGRGKSSFVAGEAAHAALAGKRVLVASTEDTAAEYLMRMLTRVSGVPYRRIKTHEGLDGKHMEAARQAANRLAAAPLRIAEALSLEDVLGEATSFSPDLLVVDFLQTLAASSKGYDGSNRNSELDVITRELKAWARADRGRVIVASQLSRPARTRQAGGMEREDPNAVEPEPDLWDLRDSGGLEQNANHVLFLWRGPSGLMSKMAKNKDGEVGYLPLAFDGATMTWSERR